MLGCQGLNGILRLLEAHSGMLSVNPDGLNLLPFPQEHQAAALYPDSVLARGGRGVLLARLGKRAEALKDAEAALLLDPRPSTLYQVACIYALTSKEEAPDRLKALSLLSTALRSGFGLEWVDSDHDLDPIRDLPEFRRIVSAAKALRAEQSSKLSK